MPVTQRNDIEKRKRFTARRSTQGNTGHQGIGEKQKGRGRGEGQRPTDRQTDRHTNRQRQPDRR